MSCPVYNKIDTLFSRKEDFSVDETKIRRPEFLIPETWVVTEKIDGMNIRVSLEPSVDNSAISWVVKYYGRGERSQFPPDILEHLQKTFPLEKMQALWRDDDMYQITIYGEGYGAGIQKGGVNYNKNKSFRLFDVLIGDVWLSRFNVEDVAKQLDIKCAPNLIKTYNVGLNSIIHYVRLGIESLVAEEEGQPKTIAEGIVAQTEIPLFNSQGKRLQFKLKTHDFVAGKR